MVELELIEKYQFKFVVVVQSFWCGGEWADLQGYNSNAQVSMRLESGIWMRKDLNPSEVAHFPI